MRSFYISEDLFVKNFNEMYSNIRLSRKNRIIIDVVVCLFALLLFIFKNYIAFVVMMLMTILWGIYQKKEAKSIGYVTYKNNKLLKTEFCIEILKTDIVYKRSNETLVMNWSNICDIKESTDLFYIKHDCGIVLYLPKYAFPEEEYSIIENKYREMNQKK